MFSVRLLYTLGLPLLSLVMLIPLIVAAQSPAVGSTVIVATTTLNVSICGDSLVNDGEECDVPGEIGAYSTSIAGRQCDELCQFGPYCGDGVLQTVFSEECDDGNNNDGDFCAADCTIEFAGGGGGSSGGGGGGGSSSGGSSSEPGETQVSINGRAYPGRTVNILLDAEEVGTVRADNDGDFTFSTEASPGATSLSIWAEDVTGTRSVTFNTTFDVTDGAVTNVNGVLLPPSISIDDPTVDPGDIVQVAGQTVPFVEVLFYIDDTEFATIPSDGDGLWEYQLDTGSLSVAEHILKARFIEEANLLQVESSFSTALQLFVGVDGQPGTPSDLNRDGSVDLIDFSILIFWWQTNGGASDPPADINANGNVGIEDFSILLFNWTG